MSRRPPSGDLGRCLRSPSMTCVSIKRLRVKRLKRPLLFDFLWAMASHLRFWLWRVLVCDAFAFCLIKIPRLLDRFSESFLFVCSFCPSPLFMTVCVQAFCLLTCLNNVPCAPKECSQGWEGKKRSLIVEKSDFAPPSLIWTILRASCKGYFSLDSSHPQMLSNLFFC